MTTATAAVTITLAANPGAANLTGTSTVSAVGGIAAFTDLSLDKVGSSYTLAASADGLTSATSVPFDVMPGAPAQLAFATQPDGATSGMPFGTQPVVAIRDAPGNLLAGRSATVSLALGANPGGGQLAGTMTVTTTTGLAGFADLTIAKAGVGYTLVASSTGAPNATSAPFDVSAGAPSPATSTVAVDQALLQPGDSAILALTTRDAAGNAIPHGGATVSFSATGGTSVGAIGSIVDHGNGTYTAPFVAQTAGTSLAVSATVNGAALTSPSATLRAVEFASITVGTSSSPGFACGVLSDHRAYCWGEDGFGQMGNGVFATHFLIPQPVSGSYVWSSVVAGTRHTCGATTTGVAYCWGSGDGGAVGDGSSGHGSGDNHNQPVAVSSGLTWAYLSAANDASCGITPGGAAYCWGNDTWARLGDSAYTTTSIPRAVAGGHSWGSIAVGSGNGCGLTTVGDAYCWGYAGYLAPGGTDDCGGFPCALAPQAVSGGIPFQPATIVMGGNHACAIETDGAAWCWGGNFDGQLGDGTVATRTAPAAVTGGLHFQDLAAGDAHTCGVTDTGDAYCWGLNDHGQLGNGGYATDSIPRPVAGGLKFKLLSAGQSETCGVTQNGRAYCWGQNNEGQLGDGSPISSRATPVHVVLP